MKFETTYLDSSGFIVRLEDSILVFDDSNADAMRYIEKDSRSLYVFISHGHADHYSLRVLGWKDTRPDVHYIISDDIGAVPGALMAAPGREYTAGQAHVRTLRSTDVGVAFLVNIEGQTIYHAGDLNWWHWQGENPAWNNAMAVDYKREIEKLRGLHIDLAFLPVDPRLADGMLLGPAYFLETTHTSFAVPMHFWGRKDDAARAVTSLEGLTDARVVPPMKVGQTLVIGEGG